MSPLTKEYDIWKNKAIMRYHTNINQFKNEYSPRA